MTPVEALDACIAESEALKAKLTRVRELVSHVDTSNVRGSWVSVGQSVYDGEEAGDLVVTCENLRGNDASLVAWAVNTIMDLKELLKEEDNGKEDK